MQREQSDAQVRLALPDVGQEDLAELGRDEVGVLPRDELFLVVAEPAREALVHIADLAVGVGRDESGAEPVEATILIEDGRIVAPLLRYLPLASLHLLPPTYQVFGNKYHYHT